MAAEARTDVHHGAPRCLLGLFDASAGDLTDWAERRKLYLGKTSDPESTLAAKRAKSREE
jgi:hypothetical protein